MSQTTINRTQAIAIPGMKSGIGIDHVIGKTAEAIVNIGRGVVQGADSLHVINPADVVSQIFAGFAIQSHDRENTGIAVDNGVYAITSEVNVATLGSFWIQYTGSPVVDAAVILAVSAGNEGKVTNTGGGNTVAATGWKITQVNTRTTLVEITNIGA